MTAHNPYAQFQQPQAAPQQHQPPAPPPAYGQPPAPAAPSPYGAPPPAYGQPPAPAAPSPYGAPPPAYGQPPAPQGFQPQQPQAPMMSIQSASPDATSLALCPQGEFGQLIVRIDGFAARNSQSAGSYGGPQRVVTFTICASNNPMLPVSATYSLLYRAGIVHGKQAFGVERDAGTQKQLAAAFFGLDPHQPNPPHRTPLPLPDGRNAPWDAVLADLESYPHREQPRYLQLLLQQSNRPIKDPKTQQPIPGRYHAIQTWLQAPAPGAQG